jgi:hypothetical protein
MAIACAVVIIIFGERVLGDYVSFLSVVTDSVIGLPQRACEVIYAISVLTLFFMNE